MRKFQTVTIDSIARTIVERYGPEEPRKAIPNTYSYQMLCGEKKTIIIKQINIDQNNICESQYSKSLLKGLFFLQDFKITTKPTRFKTKEISSIKVRTAG